MERLAFNRNVLLVVVALASVAAFTSVDRAEPTDEELYSQLREELNGARIEFSQKKASAGSGAELNLVKEQLASKERLLRERCFKIADEKPHTKAELGALYIVAGEWPKTEDGKRALQALVQRSTSADLEQLGQVFQSMHYNGTDFEPLARVLLQRVRENPENSNAVTLAIEVCNLTAPNEDATTAPPLFTEAANLVIDRYASSPGISNLCENLSKGFYSPPWALPFEHHLRRILEGNRDRFVRCSATIALASIVQESGESRQAEAEKLFEEFLVEFDGTVKYHASSIEELDRTVATRQLKEIRSHGLGKPAPATAGVDLDDKPIALAEYRGKVTLVSFWATWCGPCMKLVPHEKELTERFAPDNFVIVGVNSDTDLAAARKAIDDRGITWRSIRNGEKGGATIADQWYIAGYPTLYLLDRDGVVRKRWVGNPSPEDLESSVRRLIAVPSSAK